MTAGRRTKSAFATPLLLAAALVALAALVSWREHGSQFERLATAQAARVGDAIDDLQKDLTKLENMARYAVALYDRPIRTTPTRSSTSAEGSCRWCRRRSRWSGPRPSRLTTCPACCRASGGASRSPRRRANP